MDESLHHKARTRLTLIQLGLYFGLICFLLSGCQIEPSTETPVLEGNEIDLPAASGGDQVQPELDYLALKPPTKDIKFGKISVDQGLSQSSVFAIVQDNTGLMWFGTQDGLNKYNGYDFSILK